jgi:hypothetical protein
MQLKWDDSFKEKLTSPNYQIIDSVRIGSYQAHYFLLNHKNKTFFLLHRSVQRACGRSSTEDERIFTAESNRQGQDGCGQRNFKVVRTGIVFKSSVFLSNILNVINRMVDFCFKATKSLLGASLINWNYQVSNFSSFNPFFH